MNLKGLHFKQNPVYEGGGLKEPFWPCRAAAVEDSSEFQSGKVALTNVWGSARRIHLGGERDTGRG